MKRSRFSACLVCRGHFTVISPFPFCLLPPFPPSSHTHFAGKESEAQRGHFESEVPGLECPLLALMILGHLTPLALSCPICQMGNLQVTFQSCQVMDIIHIEPSTCLQTRLVISIITFKRVAGGHSAREERQFRLRSAESRAHTFHHARLTHWRARQVAPEL